MEDTPPSFEQCLEQYRDQHLAARNLAPKTRREYLNDLVQLIAFLTDGCNLISPARVEKRHLEAFLAELDRRGLRGSSRRRKVASAKSFFRYLHDLDILPFDPSQKLIPLGRERLQPWVLSEGEYGRLQLSCAHEVRDAAVIELILQTGIRLSEAAALTTVDVELPARVPVPGMEALDTGTTHQAYRTYILFRGWHAVQCQAVVRSGAQCGREAAPGAELCAFHRAIEFRAQARAFALARLSAEELEALADAAHVQGVDGEIAVLRVLLRNAALGGDLDAFRRGLASLCRLVQTKHHLDAQARDRLRTRLSAALERLGAADPPARPWSPPNSTGQGGSRNKWPEAGASDRRGAVGTGTALADALRNEAQAWGGWEALAARAGSAEEPALAREAAGLARRYQAGDVDALALLYARLEVAILAVLLHYRDVQAPPVPGLEDLQERGRTVLAEIARGWRPGVSFLGYFFRTFPDALAREARRAQPDGRAAVESPDQPPGRPWSPPNSTGQGGSSTAADGPQGPFWAADLTALPVLERRVVVLRALEGQPLKSVARQVGVPVSTAMKLYERARGRLERRGFWPEGQGSIAMRRLVRALHVAARPNGRLPNRDWAMSAAGLKQGEYNQLMARLEAAGAVYGRRRRKAGYLAERDTAATLARVGLREGDGAVGRA